jgi:hypothetical protein
LSALQSFQKMPISAGFFGNCAAYKNFNAEKILFPFTFLTHMTFSISKLQKEGSNFLADKQAFYDALGRAEPLAIRTLAGKISYDAKQFALIKTFRLLTFKLNMPPLYESCSGEGIRYYRRGRRKTNNLGRLMQTAKNAGATQNRPGVDLLLTNLLCCKA